MEDNALALSEPNFDRRRMAAGNRVDVEKLFRAMQLSIMFCYDRMIEYEKIVPGTRRLLRRRSVNRDPFETDFLMTDIDQARLAR